MGEGSRTGGDVVDSVTRMRKTLMMMMRTGVVAMGDGMRDVTACVCGRIGNRRLKRTTNHT